MAIEKDLTDVALDIIRIEYNTYLTGVRRDYDLDMSYFGVTMTTLETVNRMGMTPLILAAQKGNVPVVQALLRCGVDICFTKPNSYTGPAILQAAHHGHVHVIECIINFVLQNCHDLDCSDLMKTTNRKYTTPLMRAAQEGHLSTVQLLLKYKANVNSQNIEGMTALMFAVHRGHVDICQLLIDHGANVNQRSERKSTPLLIACKRGHVAIVKSLLIAGCELDRLDHEYRTARQVIQTRMIRREEALVEPQLDLPPPPNHHDEDSDSWVGRYDQDDYRQISIRTDASILRMLHPDAQFLLMQHSMRVQRTHEIIRIHTLLNDNRANIKFKDDDTHNAAAIVHRLEKGMMNSANVSYACSKSHSSIQACLQQPLQEHDALFDCLPCTQMLIRTMLLPVPLVKLIAIYLPLPNLWGQQIDRLINYAEPNEAILVALNIIDEMLESNGFLSACDAAKIPVPSPHLSWCDWKRSSRAWGDTVLDGDDGRNAFPNDLFLPQPRHSSLKAQLVLPQDGKIPTLRELRLWVNYTSLLKQYASHTNIVTILSEQPYDMPPTVIAKLIQLADIASICRRCCIEEFLPLSLDPNYNSDVNFESNVVGDIVELVREMHAWHNKTSINEL